MGTSFTKKDVPFLVNQFVHFASPRFWGDPPCLRGKVKYVDASSEPKILYLSPVGEDYLVRVDVDCYELAEKIEENEQHSSH